MKAESYIVLIWIIGSIAIAAGTVPGGWLLSSTGADQGGSIKDVWLPFGTYTDISGVKFKLTMDANDMVTLYQDRDVATAPLSRNLVLKGDGVELTVKDWFFNGDPTTSGMFLADITVSPPILSLTRPLFRSLTMVKETGPGGWRIGAASGSHVGTDSQISIVVGQVVPIPITGGVTLYRDPGYTGISQTFTSEQSYLGDVAIGNDTVSSIIVRSGWAATIYRDINYGGASLTVTDSISDLSAKKIDAGRNWDDEASSIKVYPSTPPARQLIGKVIWQDGATTPVFIFGMPGLPQNVTVTRKNYLASSGSVKIELTDFDLSMRKVGTLTISDIDFPPIQTSTPVLPDPPENVPPPKYTVNVKARDKVINTDASVQFKYDNDTKTTPYTASEQTGYHYITIMDTETGPTYLGGKSRFIGWDSDGDYSNFEFASTQIEVNDNGTFTALYWMENIEQKLKDAVQTQVADAVQDLYDTIITPLGENLKNALEYIENLGNTITGLGGTISSLLSTIGELQLSDNIISQHLTTPNIIVFSSLTLSGGLPNYFAISTQNATVDSVTVTDDSGTLYSGTGTWFSVTPKKGTTTTLDIKYTPTNAEFGGQKTYTRDYQVNYTLSYYFSGDNTAGSSSEYAQTSMTPLTLIIVGGILALIIVTGIKLWRRKHG